MDSQYPANSSICVFCGASPGRDPAYMDMAAELGRAIARKQLRLVYGGGGWGLMGAAANSAHDAGGDVLGVIPEFLVSPEKALAHITHNIVPNMHERKMQMYEQSNAFIILPGGVGTLEEAVEIMSWMRLQLHQKPIVFLAPDGYWNPLLTLLEHTVAARMSPDWLLDDIRFLDNVSSAISEIEKTWALPKKALKPVTAISNL